MSEIRIRSVFQLIKVDEEQFQRDQDLFLEMNTERNDLVHHFLENWSLKSIESLQAAIEHLDGQRERVLRLHTHLKSLFDTLQDSYRGILEFIDSPEGQRQFELCLLQQSKIVALLYTTAQQLARPDGWAMLEAAANVLVKEAHEDLVSIKKRYGHRSLKALAVASELFDISPTFATGP